MAADANCADSLAKFDGTWYVPPITRTLASLRVSHHSQSSFFLPAFNAAAPSHSDVDAVRLPAAGAFIATRS